MKVEHKNSNKKSSIPPKAFSAEELLFDLANLPEKGVSGFRKRWDWQYSRYSDEEILTRRDELRLFWTHRLWEHPHQDWLLEMPLAISKQERDRLYDAWYADHSDAFRPTLPKRTKKLYANWEEDCLRKESSLPYGEVNPSTLEETICEHWLKLEPVWWRVLWEKRTRTIGIQPKCLPAMLAATCLRVVEELGFCRNPKCSRRYFFLQRRDQLYCSSECAKPARRASKLRWWREHRGRKTKGAVAAPVFLGSPGKQRHSPLRPPLKGKGQGGGRN